MTAKNHNDQALIFGHDDAPALVAVEWQSGKTTDNMVLYTRHDDHVEHSVEEFCPYLWLADKGLLDDCEEPCTLTTLEGDGSLRILATFESWASIRNALKHIKKQAGKKASAPDAPFFFINDPVQQYLMFTGKTLFKNLPFSKLNRMQIDIETYTEPGFDFCNASRDIDRITAIAMADSSGWSEVLNGAELNEKQLLQEMVERIQQRDPDIIEGHNLFNFDLPYITTRAKKCGIKLKIGRDGSTPRTRASRFSAGERTNTFTRAEIHGRHVIDTYFLVQLYDVTYRSLESFGLKNAAIHFGVAAPDRTYVDGKEISHIFDTDPDRLMRYAHDDILETRALATILSPVYFAQAQMLPFSYQNICVRGNATKIDALIIREYLRNGQAIPCPQPRRTFAGGYTDMFYQGVALNVHHCDVRSLYPSIMLKDKLAPESDELGAFLRLLDYLRSMRLGYKDQMNRAENDDDRIYNDAVQSCLKILINSFYGYLGFAQGHFNDYDAAENITERGRNLLRQMINTIESMGGQNIEIDTDGIYFIPPENMNESKFQDAFIQTLPDGIDVEFDGTFQSMFSYKMKNYALLDQRGEMVIKGAALKSRGLERFQRSYLKEYLRFKLEQRDTEIPALQKKYEQTIRNREYSISMLSKSETLQGDPATYASKVEAGGRSRNAAYELALASKRKYRAGDQLAYYVTGDNKNVTVYSAAKPVAEWDPERRDENVPYYLEKLKKLFKNFGDETLQQSLF